LLQVSANCEKQASLEGVQRAEEQEGIMVALDDFGVSVVGNMEGES
jgi:hypothetical protein